MTRIGQWFEYCAVLLAVFVLRFMPLPWVQNSAKKLGLFAYNVLGFRRAVVRDNLAKAFPSEPSSKLNVLGIRVVQNVATSLFELLWFPQMSREVLKSLVDFRDLPLFQQLHRRGKGLVVVTAHVGNWELIPPALFLETGIPIHSLYKPQSNPLIDKYIAGFRTRFGTSVVPLGLAVREILRALQQGDGVLVAADQSAPKESIWMEFFGRSVPVFQGPAAFCLKSRAPMVSVFALRTEEGRYLLRCREIPSDDLEYSDEGIRILTERHVRETEAVIREHPHLWMWTHRRWKHARSDEDGGMPA